MFDSGDAFFTRYERLARQYHSGPFVRASQSERVVESAEKFSEGFHKAKLSAVKSDQGWPYGVLEIDEASGAENPLLPKTSCPASQRFAKGDEAREAWARIFTPAIQSDLIRKIGVYLEQKEIITLMDMCPVDTVARPSGSLSPFCRLFTKDQWEQYDYYMSLNKYYNGGPPNPVGLALGVGFVNELIARLTGQKVQDRTSTNPDLDFPLDRGLYADFAHGDPMLSIMFALRLWDNTPRLEEKKFMSGEELRHWSAARTIPFSGKMYVEKLSCEGEEEEAVRVLVNGRVMPLEMCPGAVEGRCKLSQFVTSLEQAQEKGTKAWEELCHS